MRKIKSRVLQVLVTLFAIIHGGAVIAQSQDIPLPEFFGVYVVSDGKLLELKEHSQSSTIGMAIMGADLLRDLPGPRLPNGDIQIIIYTNTPLSLMEVPVHKIARVAGQVKLDLYGNVSSQRELFEQTVWHVTNDGSILRIAPVSEKANMLRAVPKQPFGPGLWGLLLGGALFDFKVGSNPFDAAPCVDRLASLGGATYRPCPPPPPPVPTISDVIAEIGEDGAPISFKGYYEKFDLTVESLKALTVQLLEKQKESNVRSFYDESKGRVVVRTSWTVHTPWAAGTDPFEKITSYRWDGYLIYLNEEGPGRAKLQLRTLTYRGFLDENANRYRIDTDSKTSQEVAQKFLKKLSKQAKKASKGR